LELLIDFKNATELAIQFVARDMGKVQINAHACWIDREALVDADVKDFARGDIARYEVSVFGKPFFEEKVPLGLRDLFWWTSIVGPSRNPDASTFSTRRFAHEPKLIGTRNRGGVNLNKLTVAVLGSSLEASARSATGAKDRHGRTSIDQPATAGGNDDRVGWERSNLHRYHVLSHATDTASVIVQNRP